MIALYYGIHAIIGLALLGLAFSDTKRLLWLCAFLLPLQGLSFFVGVQFTWPRVIFVALMIRLALTGTIGTLWKTREAKLVLAFCSYAALITMWALWGDPETKELMTLARGLDWGIAQTDYRPLIQLLVSFISLITPLLFGVLAVTGHNALTVFRGYVWGAVASVAFGAYQVGAQVLGLPWGTSESMQEIVQGGMGMRESLQHYTIASGISIPRLYGLGGEPKHTAAFTLLALAILLSSIAPSLYSRKLRLILLIALAMGVILTFSTSGWITLVILLLVILVGVARTGGRASSTLAWVGMVSLLVMGVVILMPRQRMEEISRDRLTDRLSSGLKSFQEVEYKDGALIDFAARKPIDLILGKGAGCTDFFLIPFVSSESLRPGSTITPTYLITRTLGDYGLVGLLLLTAIVVSLLNTAKKMHNVEGVQIIEYGVIVILLTPAVAFMSFLTLACTSSRLGRASEPHSQGTPKRGRAK